MVALRGLGQKGPGARLGVETGEAEFAGFDPGTDLVGRAVSPVGGEGVPDRLGEDEVALGAGGDEAGEGREVRGENDVDWCGGMAEKGVDGLGDAAGLEVEGTVGGEMLQEEDVTDGGAGGEGGAELIGDVEVEDFAARQCLGGVGSGGERGADGPASGECEPGPREPGPGYEEQGGS